MPPERPRDPEQRAHEREIADDSNDYKVVLIHDPDDTGEGTVLGELDETFNTDMEADYAAADAAVPDVGIKAETRVVTASQSARQPREVVREPSEPERW